MDLRLEPVEGRFRLLQLTPALLDSLQSGDLHFAGGANGSVTLCTSDSTHLVRRLKQSNTLMLAWAQSKGLQAFACPSELLETVEIAGNVDWSAYKLLDAKNAEVLEPNLSLQPPEGFVQCDCSASEFRSACRRKPAVFSNNELYVINSNTVNDAVVELVAAMVESGDTELELTPNFKKVAEGCGLPEVVLEACFLKFCNEEDSKLNKEELSRFAGLYILKQHPGGMEFTSFMREWAMDLPARLPINFDLLEGAAVKPTPSEVVYIEASELPEGMPARMSYLFSVKREWLLSEMKPFVLPLLPQGQRLENWLLKFVRRKKQGSDFLLTPLRG